jgi:SAM-dependent methyltransferase
MITAANIRPPSEINSAEPPRSPRTNAAHAPGVPNFNLLARIYRWLEWLSFGPILQRCRCAFLRDLASPRKALVLGDGDGRFTAVLLAQNSALQIDAVDASSAMLAQLLQAAAQNANRVTCHLGDARTWAPAVAHYDLIATHFFLDCLTTSEVAALAARIRSHVNPTSQWLVSEFAIPTGLFGKFVARPLVALLYRAFRLLTGLRVQRLPNHREALAQAGFTLVRQRKSLGGILVAELWMPIPPADRRQRAQCYSRVKIEPQ